MSLDPIDIGKQMQKYADAITAFAIVQGVGLCLLIPENARLACIVKTDWFIAAPLVLVSYIAYGFLVRGIQRAEKVCSEETSTEEKLREITGTVRKGRLLLLLIVGIGLVALILGTRFGPTPNCRT
jgi:hypothetical protein